MVHVINICLTMQARNCKVIFPLLSVNNPCPSISVCFVTTPYAWPLPYFRAPYVYPGFHSMLLNGLHDFFFPLSFESGKICVSQGYLLNFSVSKPPGGLVKNPGPSNFWLRPEIPRCCCSCCSCWSRSKTCMNHWYKSKGAAAGGYLS